MADASKTTFGELASHHLGMIVLLRQLVGGLTFTHGGPMVLSSILHEGGAVTLRGDGRQMIHGPADTSCEVFTPDEMRVSTYRLEMTPLAPIMEGTVRHLMERPYE